MLDVKWLMHLILNPTGWVQVRAAAVILRLDHGTKGLPELLGSTLGSLEPPDDTC